MLLEVDPMWLLLKEREMNDEWPRAILRRNFDKIKFCTRTLLKYCGVSLQELHVLLSLKIILVSTLPFYLVCARLHIIRPVLLHKLLKVFYQILIVHATIRIRVILFL